MPSPTTGILDAFTRADSATLGANYTTDPFFEAAASPRIVSNAVQNAAVTSYNLVWWNAATYGPDMESYLTISTNFNAGAYRAIYLLVGVQQPSGASATGDGYMAEWVRDGTLNIYRYTNGTTGAPIATASGVTISGGDQAFFEQKAGVLTFYQNGTARLSVSDATYTGVTGSIGFGIYDQSVKIGVVDNFGGGTVVTGTTNPRRRALLGVGV